MNRYEHPAGRVQPQLGPVATADMAAGPASGVTVTGVEITQATQDMNNSIRLIADKSTVVRVYLRPNGPTGPTLVTGELAWRRGGTSTLLPAMNRIRLDPAALPTLSQQRANLDLSLNFRLPATALAAGPIEVILTRAFVPGGGNLVITGPAQVQVSFIEAPPLRLRVVGLRWRRPGHDPVTPDALHFSMLRSFLLRAYPIARLEWSQIVVDADASFQPPFRDGASDVANMQLLALRSRDIAGGFDARTRYYGLVANLPDDVGNTTMRGSAMLNDASRVFGKIASGPAGVPNGWAGDFDQSFADWYGAHELGHTCQRFHPGFPPPDVNGGQDKSDLNFPYPGGLISPPGGGNAGFDMGDPEWNRPMRALPGETHHDIMTYEDNQWLSPYTYHAILDQLLREETGATVAQGITAPAATPGGKRTGAKGGKTTKTETAGRGPMVNASAGNDPATGESRASGAKPPARPRSASVTRGVSNKSTR